MHFGGVGGKGKEGVEMLSEEVKAWGEGREGEMVCLGRGGGGRRVEERDSAKLGKEEGLGGVYGCQTSRSIEM
jgi:hypothetical protein